MELIWLLGNLHPDHKTIADFRSQQTSGIHECCLDFRRFLVSSGYISGKLVAVDGSKIKANVNRDGLTLDGINRQLALLDTRLEKYLHQLNENDLVETAHEQLSELSDELGVESSLLEKIARLSQQVEELQAEKQRMLDEGSKRSFPADPEARLMKTRNGFVPAYNVQSVIDSQHHLIGAMQVTDHPNDFEDLQPSIHAMQEELQIEVIRMVGNLHRTYQMVLGIYHRLNIVSRNEAVTSLHQTSFGISGKAPFRTFIQHTLFFGLKLFNLLA